MAELSKLRRLIQRIPYLTEALALLATLVFLGIAFRFAHTAGVTMDEGTYLMKGLLFARGDFRPFQDYGPWTNKMPLSFLIPGAAEMLFGAGLRTGRYFSIFLSLFTMFFLYLTVRRLAGKGWAIIALWVIAINPVWIAFYVHASTQPIIACLLMAMLALILGNERPLWQVILAGVIAALVVLTRQNMAPVLLFVPVYAFWQHGNRAGWLASIAMLLTFFVGHIVYYPRILAIWSDMLPFSMPILDQFSPKLEGAKVIPPFQRSFFEKFTIFLEGFRYYFLPLVGLVFAWLLWKNEHNPRGMTLRRVVISLSLLVVILWAIHIYGALGANFCPFCYSGYISFFSPAILLLVVVTMGGWSKHPGQLRSALAVLLVLVFATIIGYSAHPALKWLLTLPVPRLRNGQILSGRSELWYLLTNKFGVSYETLTYLLPALAGLLMGMFALVIGVFYARFHRDKIGSAYIAVVIFLALGTVLLFPIEILGSYSLRCGMDVIARTEVVGKQLASEVPPKSLVYWENDLSPLPLLYIERVRIFPPQLNHWYSYFTGGNPDTLAKSGFWNAELAQRWMQEADFMMLAKPYVDRWYANAEFRAIYDEVDYTLPSDPCDRSNGTPIYIFRKNN
jgi:4-amino-4-deoxy-L-arabinose transferase-like glycosyltransferase